MRKRENRRYKRIRGGKSDSSLRSSAVFSLVLVHSIIAIESETIKFDLDMLGGKWSYSSSTCIPKGQISMSTLMWSFREVSRMAKFGRTPLRGLEEHGAEA